MNKNKKGNSRKIADSSLFPIDNLQKLSSIILQHSIIKINLLFGEFYV